MAHLSEKSSGEGASQSFAADSLAMGMLVMLAMTIIQRGVGFFRGIWICRMLDDSVVGQWAMALGFILLITPVMMLGIPGSLPRYTEHFRLRGHLKAFVRRLAMLTAGFTALFFVAVAFVPSKLAWFIFLEPQDTQLVYCVAAAVGAISAFYFVNELLSGLRQVRVVSLMQFVQSLSFTAIALAVLYGGYGLHAVILSFAVATSIALIPGLWVLCRGWSGVPVSEEPFKAPSMWRRLLPFAAALWAVNLLGNVFDLSDRYMILHFTPGGEVIGQAAVGQYHSGRIVPVLLISLGMLISGVLMPYLSADWENGNRQAVRDRMRRVLLAMSAVFTLGGAFSLLIAPWMFGTLLQGRYNDGLTLMPMAFVFCTWAAMVIVANGYLLVIEKGKLVALATGIGLTANIVLNALLLPVWGLHGAVVSTLCSHGIVMLGVWVAMSRTDFRFDRTLLYVSMMPATLLAGPWVAAASVLICMAASEHAREWTREAIDLVLAKRQQRSLA
ncbi:MurJ-like flippase [Planctomycetes bacterium K23_9]|uniref:MurJ-like flippase n=1 Tax=Stieleria marina TaxID=1930275 RepID=A0A517NSJ6_9BACT|nr:MurJ-like flippase [Planctomycetes bacterium K23_9]